MNLGCIIQARTLSTRLPGKVLKKVDKKHSLLEHVILQLRHCKKIDHIVIATTKQKIDDDIVILANEINVDFFRGSENDVLDRYYQCAKKFSFSSIVRITSDNPLIDPTVVDDVIEMFRNENFDYVSNNHPRSFPNGTESEVFSQKALEIAWKGAKKPSEREHVTPYFSNNPSKFKIGNLKYRKDISNLSWSVDRENDLELVRNIVLKIKKKPILMTDILELFQKEPKLKEINKDHIIDEGYKKSLKDDSLPD